MHLAIAMQPVLPSANVHSVGTPKFTQHFAAQYLACTSACQRFADMVAMPAHDSELL